jgi:hypothetical protein
MDQIDLNHIWSIEVNQRIFLILFYFIYYYLGYIDDVRNTDNAWVEAEIWNFHYGSTTAFPNLRTDVC